MYDCNVLYSILLTHSMSVLSTDVSTVCHYCLLMSVLHSMSVLSTDVSIAQYLCTAQYLRSLLSTDVSTVQYLRIKY